MDPILQRILFIKTKQKLKIKMENTEYNRPQTLFYFNMNCTFYVTECRNASKLKFKFFVFIVHCKVCNNINSIKKRDLLYNNICVFQL